MFDLTFRFLGLCHAAGLSASTAESIACLQALAKTDLSNPECFRAAVSSTLAGDREQKQKVLTLLELFFAGNLHSLETEPGKDSPQLQKLSQWMEEHEDEPLSETLQRMQKTASKLEGDQRENREGVVNQSVRLRELFLDGMKAAEDLPGDESETSACLPAPMQQAARQKIVRYMEEARSERTKPRLNSMEMEHAAALLANRPLRDLDESQMAVLGDEVRRLAKQLRDVITRRRARRRRGHLDVKRTLALAARTDGVPFHLVYRARHKRKERVVVLCDLSRSVEPYARFMIGLLHAMQQHFHQVRTFGFVSKIEEVTSLLTGSDVNAAMDDLFREAAFRFGPASDYGLVFDRFTRHHLDALTQRTTLVVLGDARNNFGAARRKKFRRMADACKRVIWLNPEEADLWDTGDSEMGAYGRYAIETREVSRLSQLMEFIDDLAG